MKKLKKIMLSIAVLMLVIPLSIGLTACGEKTDNPDNTDGTVTGSSTIVGTWTFGTKSSTNMITEVKVADGKVTINYKRGSSSTTCTAGTGGSGTSEVSVNTTNNTFTASDASTGNQVWSISGSLNDDGMLVITGTITLIGGGYVSSPETVSQTATSYKA